MPYLRRGRCRRSAVTDAAFAYFWAVFLCSILLCSVIEWLTGFVLEKVFHRKWWDYSDVPFNISGYVCPIMSLLWGGACLVVVYAVQPAIGGLVDLLPTVLGYVLMGVCAALFIADFVLTVLQISKFGKHLKELEEINKAMRFGSDAIGSAISALTVKSAEKLEPITQKGEKAASEIKSKYEQAKAELEKKVMGSRIGKAFPHLHKKHDTEGKAIEKPDNGADNTDETTDNNKKDGADK